METIQKHNTHDKVDGKYPDDLLLPPGYYTYAYFIEHTLSAFLTAKMFKMLNAVHILTDFRKRQQVSLHFKKSLLPYFKKLNWSKIPVSVIKLIIKFHVLK